MVRGRNGTGLKARRLYLEVTCVTLTKQLFLRSNAGCQLTLTVALFKACNLPAELVTRHHLPKDVSGWLQGKSARKVVAMPLGKNVPSMQTKAGKAKGGTLDARFTRLLELRGDASARQTGAREQLLAKKRGMKAAPVVTEAWHQFPASVCR